MLLSRLICLETLVALEFTAWAVISPSVQDKLDNLSLQFIGLALTVWHLPIIRLVVPKIADKLAAFIEKKLGVERQKEDDPAEDPWDR